MNSFETKSLDIRYMTVDDCDYAAMEWGDEEYGKYLVDEAYRDGDHLREILKSDLEMSDEWSDGFYFSVFEKSTDSIVGTACLFQMEGDLWGIGYTISHNHWRLGYATELVGGLCEYAKAIGIKTISSDVVQENVGSVKACMNNGFEIYSEDVFRKRNTNIEYKSYDLRKKL